MDFTTEMKEFYDQNGYLVVENVFSPAELAPMQARIDAIAKDPSLAPEGVKVSREADTAADSNDAEYSPVRAIAFMATHDPLFREAAQNAKLLELVRGLIGPRIKVFRDQMLLKPPGGQAKPVHQDQSYFRVQPENDLVTAWIALDDATTQNGCMVYVPESHRHGIFPIQPDPHQPVHHIPDAGDIKLRDEVICPVPAGSVIFHHGCTLHRSEVNRTETWRRAVIFHYSTSEARSEHDFLNEQVTLEID